MNTAPPQSGWRNWRLLLTGIAILTVFGTAFSPASALHAAAAAHTAPSAGLAQAQRLLFNDLVAQAATTGSVPGDPAASKGRLRYFSQSGHFMKGAFLTYWETHGGLPVFGVPLTEPLVQGNITVQYLERARFEWHPEIADVRQQVLLTRLGVITAEERGLVFDRAAEGSNTLTTHFFSETGHNLSNAFLSFWQRNGGLAVYGYPISEETVETSPTDGRQYTVQYFERNRFEWHPEQSPSYNVQLGLLGAEYERETNLDPLVRILLPSNITNNQDLTDSPRLADYVDADLIPAIKALGRTPQFKWVPALIVQNKIFVEFSQIDEEGVAGAFIATNSKTRPYVIVVPETQRGEPVEALASVLAHEATHAHDTISGVISPRSNCSVEEEVRAYLNGLGAWLVLKGNDALVQRYTPGSFEFNINRSLRDFNSGETTLTLDFDLQAGRAFVSDLYGASCGR